MKTLDINTIESLAIKLMDIHGLTDWKFKWSKAKTICGYCSYRNKTIALSSVRSILNSEGEIRDTILHEIAHALVGSKHGHDEVWRNKAISIGCSGTRCSTERITLEYKYKSTCPTCGKKSKAHKRSFSSCGKCDTKFNKKHLLIWTTNVKESIES